MENPRKIFTEINETQILLLVLCEMQYAIFNLKYQMSKMRFLYIYI